VRKGRTGKKKERCAPFVSFFSKCNRGSLDLSVVRALVEPRAHHEDNHRDDAAQEEGAANHTYHDDDGDQVAGALEAAKVVALDEGVVHWWARQLVAGHGEGDEVRQVNKLGGDRASQLIFLKKDPGGGSEVAELRGDGASELVSAQGEGRQNLQVHQRDRNAARQLVVAHGPKAEEIWVKDSGLSEKEKRKIKALSSHR